jgi:HlyD family secretion protein
MRKARSGGLVAILLALVSAVLIYSGRRPVSAETIIGVVRATEVRVEPEVTGQLTSIAVKKGAHVHAGDVLARLSAIELTAQAGQARAALTSATANRAPRICPGTAGEDQHAGSTELRVPADA